MSQPSPGSQTASQRSSPGESGTNGRSPGWKFGPADACLAAAVGLAVLLVHDLPYLLHQSFWVDEAWVADSVRAPIGLTPSLSSSTPVGWTVLLRLVPFGGPQRLRLVPLAFALLAAVAGYLFGRELRLTRYTTPILTGAAVLLSPAILIRDDLKQYTAEAFACLVLWVLVARIENDWRRWRLVAIAATASAGLLFANTVIIVGVAAMASLALECLIKRHYRRLAEVAVASAGMLAVGLVIYVAVIRPGITSYLTAYWHAYYMPTRSASAEISFLNFHMHHLAQYMGFRWLAVDAALALGGIAALIWLRRFALAALLPVTLAVLLAASAAGKYPFGNLRTSTFWLVAVPLLMAVAVAAVAHWAAALHRWAPAVITAVALAVWVPATGPYIRSHQIPNADVRAEVVYLDAHFRRGDVVIVNYGASYGFAYYYPVNPSFPAGHGPNGHLVAYPDAPWIVMTVRAPAAIAHALATARAKVAAEPAGTRGRIWIVRSQPGPGEYPVWQRDLAGGHVTVIRVGPDPLLLYRP